MKRRSGRRKKIVTSFKRHWWFCTVNGWTMQCENIITTLVVSNVVGHLLHRHRHCHQHLRERHVIVTYLYSIVFPLLLLFGIALTIILLRFFRCFSSFCLWLSSPGQLVASAHTEETYFNMRLVELTATADHLSQEFLQVREFNEIHGSF